MVCESCEKKLPKVSAPDPWKAGSRNTNETGRKINENKLLASKNRFTPYDKKCTICKSKVPAGIYCQGCAYKKGLCSMCGKMILDISSYKQSSK